ncbi:MAG TPA: hypothetical protein GX717_03075 [Clostridiaceae bacterium]|nr:hypothetical protein [Clostridiaceae bacterium]
MQSFVLVMRRCPVAAALQKYFQEYSDEGSLSVVCENDYNRALDTISKLQATAALIEVAECGPGNLTACLTLCQRLRRCVPDCGILLMCPEDEEDVVAAILQSKRNGLFDDFVFYDASFEYTALKLLTMR